MQLITIFLGLILGAILISLSSIVHRKLPYYLSLFIQLITLNYFLDILWSSFNCNNQTWLAVSNIPWIPILGANIHLIVDGFSGILIILTLLLSIVATIYAKDLENPAFFHTNLFVMLIGIIGIFLSADLLLFFFCWELMLVPMYLLIVRYQQVDIKNVAFKFLIYTQTSGLFMLLSIIALYFIQAHQSYIYSFDLNDIRNVKLSYGIAAILMTGFLIAFLVKLAVIPFHGWVPPLFKAGPLAVILVGILVKTGAYGIFRIVLPIFPELSIMFAPTAMAIGVVTIIYAAFLAYTSNDIRNIAAYSSISHTGFILIGIYSYHILGWYGVTYQIIASALAIAGLLVLAQLLYHRTQTYDIRQMGGLWSQKAGLSGSGMLIILATLGLPGLANFIAEFLILTGTFQQNIFAAIFASMGLILAAAYSLRIVQKIFAGNYTLPAPIKDITLKDKIVFMVFSVLLIFFGLYSKPITKLTLHTFENILFNEPNHEIPNENPNEVSVKVFK